MQIATQIIMKYLVVLHVQLLIYSYAVTMRTSQHMQISLVLVL